MKKRTLCVVSLLVLSIGPAGAGEDEARAAVDAVLTSLHTAASQADGELYFGLFAEDAIFMGTDSTERWTVDDFKVFAEPYFSKGRGWTYTMTERHIYFSTGGDTAWFDEMLSNENYGTCRGTGVLRKTDAGWLFVQYNLTIPIPNDLAGEISAAIKDFEATE